MKHFLPVLLCSIFFNVASQEVEKTYLSPLSQPIDHILLSPDKKTLIAADQQGYVFLWTIKGDIYRISRNHLTALSGLVVSHDGRFLATSADSLITWRFAGGVRISAIGREATPLAFGTEDSSLYLTMKSGLLQAVDQQFSKHQRLLNTTIEAADASDDGSSFALAGEGMLTIANISGKEVTRITCCQGIIKVEYKRDKIGCLCSSGYFELFELRGNKLRKLGSTPITSNSQPKFIITEEGDVLFTQDEKPFLWKIAAGKNLEVPDITQPVTALSYGENGRYYIGYADGKIELRKILVKDETETQVTSVKETFTAETGKVEMTTAGVPKAINGRPIKASPVKVNAQMLNIYVWDDERQDGDTISLNFNGKWILENYMITAEKKKITISLRQDGVNFLMLYANNLGKFPPNTAVISFNDGKTERLLTLESDMKRCGAVNFILKK